MSADPSSYSSTAASSASSLLASSPQPPSSTSASTPPLSSTNPEMPLPRATARAVPAYRSYLPKRPNLSWRRGFRTQPSLAKDQGPLGPGSPIPPTAGGPYEEIPNGGKKKRRGVGSRLRSAWKPRSKWIPIPFVGAIAYGIYDYQQSWGSSRPRDRASVGMTDDGEEMVVKLRGPWQVHVMGALPLRSLSRLWGYLNSFELPVWSREPGFRMYAWAFGCNLDELEQPDLKQYASLGDFFYRKLKPGVRPIADVPLVSPADGKLLHFGAISGAKVEQVKGMSYSLDALLGKSNIPGSPKSENIDFDTERAVDDQDFANINDIDYSLGDLLGSGGHHLKVPSQAPPGTESEEEEALFTSGSTTPTSISSRSSTSSTPGSPKEDASVPTEMFADRSRADSVVHDASVALSMGAEAIPQGAKIPKSSVSKLREGNGLFFTVIYLAPGDYHRFHSPTAWVVERRRHFAGELFSVSPYIARRLSNLFVLNERVALLGRWRYGFFGMVPVGATNVGSIKINFDQALRTNNRLRPHPAGTYIEAVYSKASSLLRGQPLSAGDEMGGFKLGSTIVLIFEAPKNFTFAVEEGQKIKVGEAIGYIPGESASSPTPSPKTE